jgi:hypothetical protein
MIKLEDFESALTIDKGALDDELVHQSSLYYEVSKAHTDAIDARDAAKDNLGVIEAEVENELRETAEKEGEKITEAQVKALVKTDKDRKKAYDTYANLRRKASRLGDLKESFIQRSHMLKHLCEIYVANYFETNSVRGTSRTDTATYIQQRHKISAHRRNNRS